MQTFRTPGLTPEPTPNPAHRGYGRRSARRYGGLRGDDHRADAAPSTRSLDDAPSWVDQEFEGTFFE